MEKHVLELAHKLDQQLHAEWLEYLAECEQWHKRGYVPRYCEHGTNQWTDYDNICGGCEEGWSKGDPMQRRRYALDMAQYRMEDVRKITSAFAALINLVGRESVNADLVADKVRELVTV